MLKNIQPEIFCRMAKNELDGIKQSLRLLAHVNMELNGFQNNLGDTEREILNQKNEKLKIDLRDKLKSMGLNINEMVSLLDYKITVIVRQIAKIQKNIENPTQNRAENKATTKLEEQYRYQINQLEERIFELQKKQNQYVKEISQLKEKNANLRDEFNSLSFDSNQRIKELSEKLHNNTSPNLTIRKPNLNVTGKLETSYYLEEPKKTKNNFVKIKGANNLQQELSPLEVSPVGSKKKKNMLDSLTSESSDYDINGLGYQIPQNDQNSGILKFGCFPAKQVSEKTKTGSSSQNKKLNFEQKHDKSRRFEFLLNNLIDNKEDNDSNLAVNVNEDLGSRINYKAPGNSKAGGNVHYGMGYQYKSLVRGQEYKSVYNQNQVRRYQI